MGLTTSNNYMSDVSDDDDSDYYSPRVLKNEIDAVLKQSKALPTAESVIHLDMLDGIDDNLEKEELISLVYLLYDNAHLALQEIQLWLSDVPSKKLLSSWASYENSKGSKWQSKLVEALCTIQNYEILKQVGYEKNDLVSQYLPRRDNISTYVNRVKKTVYLLCESLDKNDTTVFLNHVKKKFQEKQIPFTEYNHPCLELYFLNWETIGFITLSNMNNILHILKIMRLELQYDMLKNSSPENLAVSLTGDIAPTHFKKNTKLLKTRKVSTSTDNHLQNRNIGDDFTNISNQSNDDIKKRLNDDWKYDINPEKPGVVLIINQESFYTETNKKYEHLLPTNLLEKLESRVGTKRDGKCLEEVFELYGFKVIVKENLHHEDMIKEIKMVTMGVRDESSLFICILSHGDMGVVFGSNSCKVQVAEIQKIMCKSNKEYLKDKPKILILQSCQGNECQRIDESSDEDHDHDNTTDGPARNKPSVPDTADMLTFWATVPGYAAIRNRRTGSWFIQALYHNLIHNGYKYHFVEICTKIVGDVTSKLWEKKHKMSMTPLIHSTLRFPFYFPPIKDNPSSMHFQYVGPLEFIF